MAEFLTILVGAALVNNLVLVQFLGVSSFFSNTDKVQNAANLGLLSAGVMLASSLLNFAIFRLILMPLGLQFLQLIVFLLISGCLTWVLLVLIKNRTSADFRRQGLSMFMVGGNSAVIGISLLINNGTMSFLQCLTYGIGSACGFVLVMVLFAALHERLETTDVPLPFRGLTIDLISASLVAMAFLGFAGIV